MSWLLKYLMDSKMKAEVDNRSTDTCTMASTTWASRKWMRRASYRICRLFV